MVYGRGQTDIHTTSANAVTLVWGSLRLAPIMQFKTCLYSWYLFAVGANSPEFTGGCIV